LVLVMLNRLVQAVVRVQDSATGLWYQVLDQGDRPGNYLEASASAMFVYTMAKGVRKSYLPETCLTAACAGFNGLVTRFVHADGHGPIDLAGTCGGAGLGGEPYRDGSYEYYVSEPVVLNDYKGCGPFILAALELEGLRSDDVSFHP
jgi:unsaturated rhamnogalacturonyl hydrolase